MFEVSVEEKFAAGHALRNYKGKCENVHGHTAPFPEALPELLIRVLRPGAVVLDPFAGSLTTGRVAVRHGLRAVCIERSEEYCRLGLRMHEAERRGEHQLSLFAADAPG